MTQLPESVQTIIDKYILPLNRLPISSKEFAYIIDAMQANYAYGIAVGLALASASENKPMISQFKTGNEGIPIVNEIINATAPYEAELAQYFKEALGL